MTAIIVKYILNVIDSRQTEAWENRSVYMFYLELVTGRLHIEDESNYQICSSYSLILHSSLLFLHTTDCRYTSFEMYI
jgi:hypothetical protein